MTSCNVYMYLLWSYLFWINCRINFESLNLWQTKDKNNWHKISYSTCCLFDVSNDKRFKIISTSLKQHSNSTHKTNVVPVYILEHSQTYKMKCASISWCDVMQLQKNLKATSIGSFRVLIAILKRTCWKLKEQSWNNAWIVLYMNAVYYQILILIERPYFHVIKYQYNWFR